MPPDAVPHLSVIIPAFNEAERIVTTLDRLQAYLGACPFPSEIIEQGVKVLSHRPDMAD